VNEYGLTSPSTHYRSFRRQVFQSITCTSTDNLTGTTKWQDIQIT